MTPRSLARWTVLVAGWAGVVLVASARGTAQGPGPAPAPTPGTSQQLRYGSDEDYGYGSGGLTERERAGRDTWYFWTGGNERFWVRMSNSTRELPEIEVEAYVSDRWG